MILSVRAYRPTWERLQGFLAFLCLHLAGTMPLGRSRCLDPLPQDLGRSLVTGSMGRSNLPALSDPRCLRNHLLRLDAPVGVDLRMVEADLSRNASVGSVVLARSACANPSSFARYGPRTGPRLAHSSACASICFAITSLPTESIRLCRFRPASRPTSVGLRPTPTSPAG